MKLLNIAKVGLLLLVMFGSSYYGAKVGVRTVVLKEVAAGVKTNTGILIEAKDDIMVNRTTIAALATANNEAHLQLQMQITEIVKSLAALQPAEKK